MSTRNKIWFSTMTIYVLFVFWYTDFGGPVTEAEVAKLEATMAANGYSPEEINHIAGFFREDTGRQFLMVNNIEQNANPPAMPDMPEKANADELMAVYMRHMIPQLLKRACHPVIVGTATYGALDLQGITGGETWTDAALFRYRSRRALLDIVSNPDFSGPHDYKLAALTKTIAYPIETNLYWADLRVMLGLILLSLSLMLQLLLDKKGDHS